KPASPKLTTVPVSLEEPTRKLKRVKRLEKKSTKAPTGVSLTEEAQYKEVHKKSLRDFHKTHPSGSSTITKISPSATKIKPYVTNEGTGAKPGVPDVTEEESTEKRDSGDDNTQSDSERGSHSEHETDENETGSESDQEEIEEEIKDDKEEKEDEFVKTPSNDIDGEDETKIKDKAEGNKDEGMDYTTMQANTHTPYNVSTNPPFALPNFASVFQFNNIVTTLKKEVAELKKGDPLNTQVTALVDEHLDSRPGATIDEFMNYLSASITVRITEQVKI
ncbi:hypothetical protein Tco_1434216, partial [Tanacetum coccineum]